ncbi:MAG: chromosome segregation protein SMC, partial [bacterium]|nr:chromosome segregation protein SMC [bacterium]
LHQVETHPEIVLSRRELIRYVLATPGKRAEEVQALLHLDHIEQVRSGLQKIANSAEKQRIPLGTAVRLAVDNLSRALMITEFTAVRILQAANTQRAILGLPALIDFTATTSLKDGMATPVPAKAQPIPKTQALADIAAAREALNEIVGTATVQRVVEVATEVESMVADPALTTGVTRESFYSTGLSLIDSAACPFCDNAWDVAALREHTQSK